MSLLKRIANRIDRDYFRYQFHNTVQKITTTPSLQVGQLPFVVLSMVHHRDVHAYLVAIKSFALYANPKRVVVVCDPSITAADQSVLKSQIPHIELRHADEFTHPDIPRGGTWERLFAISEYVTEHYVVQLDADTVTLREVPEVIDAITSKHGFVIGEKENQATVSLSEAEEIARPWQSPSVHIQGLAEVTFITAGLKHDRYVRGCSGFTGFPQSDVMKSDLVDFSRKMWDKTQSRWTEWGTEQVTSNYLVANATGTGVLPFPQYATPDYLNSDSRFIHFIGSMRFINDKYQIAAQDAIKKMLATK